MDIMVSLVLHVLVANLLKYDRQVTKKVVFNTVGTSQRTYHNFETWQLKLWKEGN